MKKFSMLIFFLCLWICAYSHASPTDPLTKWSDWVYVDHVNPSASLVVGMGGYLSEYNWVVSLVSGSSLEICGDLLLLYSGVRPTSSGFSSTVAQPIIQNLNKRFRFGYNNTCYIKEIQVEGETLPEGPEGDYELIGDRGKIAIIPMDGLNIPIVIEKPSLSIVGSQGGLLLGDDMQAVTMEVGNAAHIEVPQTTLEYAPTLYITLAGFEPALAGSGYDQWQRDFAAKVAESASSGYEVAVWTVDWHNSRPMQHQIELLTNKVNHYLKYRKYAWDVVIVGHSRGGVFAHHLADAIHGNAKINSIQTFLIDPTASFAGHGDRYPTTSIGDAPSFYGDMYYDGYYWTSLPAGTISDRSIPKYTMHKVDYPHNDAASLWVKFDAQGAIDQHIARKIYVPDLKSDINTKDTCKAGSDGLVESGDCSFQVIRIRAESFEWGISGGIIRLERGIDVMVYASSGPVDIVSVNALVNDQDGVALAASGAGHGVSTIVNSERAQADYSSPLTSLTVTLKNSDLSSDVNLLGFGISNSVGLGGGSLEVNFWGTEIKIFSW